MESEFNSNPSGNEVHDTNSSIFPVKNMLCSDIHCQEFGKLKSSHMGSVETCNYHTEGRDVVQADRALPPAWSGVAPTYHRKICLGGQYLRVLIIIDH